MHFIFPTPRENKAHIQIQSSEHNMNILYFKLKYCTDFAVWTCKAVKAFKSDLLVALNLLSFFVHDYDLPIRYSSNAALFKHHDVPCEGPSLIWEDVLHLHKNRREQFTDQRNLERQNNHLSI